MIQNFKKNFVHIKIDDFKFIFEIEEEQHEKIEQKEVFYEDEYNYYTFDEIKSDYIYITTKATRGKQAIRIPLKTALNSKILTIDDIKTKKLKYNIEKK